MTFVLPAGSIDTHAHVLRADAPSMVEGAAYPAFDALPEAFLAHLDALGAARGVIVNPSTYGVDNRVLLHTLRTRRDRLLGVAVVPADVDDVTLDGMHADGVRGIRVQDRFAGGAQVADLPAMLPRLAERGWHAEVWTDVREHRDLLLDAVRGADVPVRVDHLGYSEVPESGQPDPATAVLLELLAAGPAWVALEGAYRLAPAGTPVEAAQRLAPRVRALLEFAPDRLVWGSDWPYVAPPGPTPSIADHVRTLEMWLPDDRIREHILVDNPRRLYGFPS